MATVFAPAKPLKLFSKLIAEQQAFNAKQSSQFTEREELSRVIAAIQFAAQREEWSQVEVAKKVGVPRTTWQRLCAGNVVPSNYLPKLKDAAARLQCTERPN